MIIDLLEKSVDKYRNKIAVCCDEYELTYGELYERILELSGTLAANGVNKGDHVALLLANSIEFVVAFFAVNRCGGIIIPVYVNTGANKLINIVNFYDIRFIISAAQYKTLYDSVTLEACSEMQGIFSINPEGAAEFTGLGESPHFREKVYKSSCFGNYEDLALILFSSGTTGIPKGIMLSNNNIISNVQAISDYLGLSPADRLLLVKNINHASSITGEMLISFYNGCTLYLTRDLPTPAVILQLMCKKEITVFFAVPSILFTLVRYRDFNSCRFEKLRILNFYGACMGYEEIKTLHEKFPGVNLIYSYGLTEASPRVTYLSGEELLKKQGSSGKAIRDVEIYITDGRENFESPGNAGEIAVKGPNVMLGYYKNSELTEKALRNGLLHTGDFGYMDADGFLYVVGRKDNLIIQSGKNVYPEEIEKVLGSCPGIAEALVRGEDDSFLGQKIVAYLVTADGCKPDLKEVLLHCRQNLEDYKVPREFYFIERLEKNPNGKILRNQDIKI
ncbi:MAG TPA: class I adenylate-forming enzyme family protein [Ruminiclostridium sp.]|nr:class I adenylate-forming enzyme family protein [Ruminiclostridium sp.]